MIQRGEIEAVAQQLGIHTSHVQRDYVHGWLLSLLYSASPLAKQLVLKGGSCLRKGYFEGARYSRDLDFSTASSVADSDLGRELNAICEALQERTSVSFDTGRTRVEAKRAADDGKRITEARLYFRDFYGEESQLILGVRLDVTQFDRLYLPAQERALIHSYSDANACATTIRCVKLEELLATKMRCLLQRRHIADLFDLIYATFISKQVEVDRRELLSVFFKITIFGKSPGVAKGLLIDLPFGSLQRFWADYIACPIMSRFSFEAAKDHLLSLVGLLIPEESIHDRSPILFPSSLRNPMMEAAHSLTLLKVRYYGVPRLVEPYSLVFKRRQDGMAREYFYGYDTTGGRSSGPGIKMFVPDKVESVENTDQPFQPRFEVELSKAGGSEIAGFFRGHSTSRNILGWSISRKIQCPYCLRTFTRNGPNNTLREHRDSHGNSCYGRVGYQI